MEIDLRSATSLDLDLLADLVSEYYALDALNYQGHAVRRALLELINEKDYGHIWLLEKEKQPIGYVVLTFGFIVEFHGKSAIIDEIYLRPQYRGQGYFRAALAFIESFCKKEHVRCLRLEVENKNERSREIYRKAGFHVHDRVLMTKPLD
jgi:GNAT superfamily N-acetyltransferase